MTKLLLATRNAHKAGEIRAILGGRFRFLTLNDFPGAPKVVEDADTFAGNATKKAVELAKWLPANLRLSDAQHAQTRFRSGRRFRPGSGRAERRAGRAFGALRRAGSAPQSGNTPDADNNAKLLRLLKDVPLEKRTARFHCVIALSPCRKHRRRVAGLLRG